MNSTMATINNSIQQYVLSNFSLLDQRLADNITQQNQSIKQLQDSLAFVTSIVMNTVEQELWFSCQQQLYTFKIFDLTSITKTLTNSDFTSGFAFDTLVIQNALIEVQSIAVSFTLFKTQNTFLNIKIQLDDINYGTGSILSQDSSLQIKQVSFISKPGTQVTVNAGVVLSVLQQQAVITSIQNLLLNLTIESTSQGIITLIYQVTGKLTVKGYQILGSYQSTNTIALCATIVRSESNVSLNYINIQPQVFTCGNLSSFLISYVNSSILSLLHLSVSIGSSNSHNLISAITTTLTTYFAFGGFIAYQNSSTTSISDIQYNSYESWQTAFVLYSGQILGFNNISNITVSSICLNTIQISNNQSYFYMFGIIGYANGEYNIQHISVYYQLKKGTYDDVGIIGFINGTKAQFNNIYISIQISKNYGNICGTLASMLQTDIQSIYNITIDQSCISASILVGLIAAMLCNCSLYFVTIQQSQVNGTGYNVNSYSAGIFSATQGHISVLKCYIDNIVVIAYSNFTWSLSGGIFGDIYNTTTEIQQIRLQNTTISASGNVYSQVCSSGLTAYQFNSKQEVFDVQVIQSNVSVNTATAEAYCGGFAAYLLGQTITISNSLIRNIYIQITGYKVFQGIVLGIMGVVSFSANQVMTEGINSINGVIVANCANIINQNGC
ncbi:Hypothetical_protein [Hexamita inflata]|uniref:Hypothetical_protein n=1 Tax=Hexamita inflata TaxID=28002 RepID=A0AA86R478_9EUKA|nr:Hypothetical protein HINF_LOCUS56233 [Hexamita inflata]